MSDRQRFNELLAVQRARRRKQADYCAHICSRCNQTILIHPTGSSCSQHKRRCARCTRYGDG